MHPGGDQTGQVAASAAACMKAQAERSGDRMRAAAAQRREMVQSLIQHARDLAARHGVRFSDDVERQVIASLDATLADPQAAARFEDGCLTEALCPLTFIGGGGRGRSNA